MTQATHLRATQAAYDAVAVRYAELFRDALAGLPLDRALLAAFAELVQAADVGPVADLGCGPGSGTAYLHSLGVSAFGVDLSPAMIALARREYPDLRFDECSMTALDLPAGVLGGVLAWYSIIHTPPEEMPTIIGEFHRVLAPGGHVLLGFFQADEDSPQEFDHKVSLAYRWSVDRLAELLRQAGFAEVARLTREPGESERFRRGHLLARKPTG
jgi:SAM-dependent methyltransferase